jgi:hypothetical protein
MVSNRQQREDTTTTNNNNNNKNKNSSSDNNITLHEFQQQFVSCTSIRYESWWQLMSNHVVVGQDFVIAVFVFTLHRQVGRGSPDHHHQHQLHSQYQQQLAQSMLYLVAAIAVALLATFLAERKLRRNSAPTARVTVTGDASLDAYKQQPKRIRHRIIDGYCCAIGFRLMTSILSEITRSSFTSNVFERLSFLGIAVHLFLPTLLTSRNYVQATTDTKSTTTKTLADHANPITLQDDEMAFINQNVQCQQSKPHHIINPTTTANNILDNGMRLGVDMVKLNAALLATTLFISRFTVTNTMATYAILLLTAVLLLACYPVTRQHLHNCCPPHCHGMFVLKKNYMLWGPPRTTS